MASINEDHVKLSVIIISYNTQTITRNCLDSILKSHISVPFEIIVIDNASTDGSVSMLENISNAHSNIRLIKNQKNVGFAKANNQGVQASTSPYILFLNSDTVVVNDAVEKLYVFFTENEDRIHFLGGKLMNADGSPQPSCGPFYSLITVFGALFLKGDHWGLTRYSPQKTKEVDWVSGACILTKKAYFEHVSGFDEAIFMYMDEIDLLYRAKQLRYRVFFYPQAHFIHLGSSSSKGKTYPILQVYRGFIYFYRKHHSPFDMFLLKGMLKLKALVALYVGKVRHDSYLVQTYEKALSITQEN